MVQYKQTVRRNVATRAAKRTSTASKRPYKIPMARLPRAVKPEMKRVDRVIENQSLLVLGQSSHTMTPCKIAGGIEEGQRVGNKVLARGLHLKGHFFNRSGNPCLFVRMLVLQDKKQLATDIVGSELLVKAGSNVNYDQGTESAYLSINKYRYAVLLDKTIKLGAINTNGENIKMFNHFIKLNKTLTFGGTASSSIESTNIQIFVYPINPSGTSTVLESIQYNQNATLYYNDA